MKKYELNIIERLMRNGSNRNNLEYYRHNYKFDYDGKTYNGFINGYAIIGNEMEDYGFSETDSTSMEKQVEKYFTDFSEAKSRHMLSTIFLDRADIEARKNQNRHEHIQRAYDLQLGYDLNPEYDTALHIGFNPAYMMDFIKYFKTEYCYILNDGFLQYDNDFATYAKAMYFENEEEHKVGLLLPVNLAYTKDYESKRYAA